ncbi:cardioactive peptide-like [Centruroides vittatus]|uniref:cardioactive peptide-like n=1 Tax=Centruroides vittatus TaxID=120091 RepID=UPI003510BA7B
MFRLISVILLLAVSSVITRTIEKTELPEEKSRMFKRPFCNAFTGCGRKRTENSYNSLPSLPTSNAILELNEKINEGKIWQFIRQRLSESPLLRAMVLNELSPRSSALNLDISNVRRRRSIEDNEYKNYQI